MTRNRLMNQVRICRAWIRRGRSAAPLLAAGAACGVAWAAGRRGWRWLAAAPAAFAVAVFVSPDVFRVAINGQPILSGGIGGGAIALPLFGMAGGYTLSGRGPLRSRLVVGVFALIPVPAWVTASSAFGAEFALNTGTPPTSSPPKSPEPPGRSGSTST